MFFICYEKEGGNIRSIQFTKAKTMPSSPEGYEHVEVGADVFPKLFSVLGVGYTYVRGGKLILEGTTTIGNSK